MNIKNLIAVAAIAASAIICHGVRPHSISALTGNYRLSCLKVEFAD
ncbi:MAG: hypothetical protein J6P13_06655 [Kiritimatiellae bacterium]|nr:hypothetical protein [Kiritimatiellia bacterium]